MMEILNERTSAYITVAFTDKTGAAAAPVSVTYSTYCLTTQTAIKTNTAISTGTSIEIALDADDTDIITAANKFEDKLLTVKAVYGLGDECNDEYTYRVKNLRGV